MWKTKSRRRPPSVYFRSCRPIFELFMKQRDGFFSLFSLFFFFLQCRTPKAEGLATFFLYTPGQRPAVNYIHLQTFFTFLSAPTV